MLRKSTHIMTSRLRIKFGEHELDAEGPIEELREHFGMFRHLVAPQADTLSTESGTLDAKSASPYGKMFWHRGRIYYFSVPAKSADAVLLILFAQKKFAKNENVSGAEIMRGLRRSGIQIPRADSIINAHTRAGLVAVDGHGRKRRYRLTEQGTARADELARKLAPLSL